MMAINQVCHERQLAIDIVLEAVEVALASAFKRNFGGNQSITAQIDTKFGEALIFIEKAVVEQVENDKKEISLKDAKAINPDSVVGGLVSVESTPKNFGRIAAQTAKQVILQRIREAERDALYSAYAVRTLSLTPALLGIVISAGGIGALVGAAAAGRVTRRFGVGPALIGGLAFHGFCSFLVPLANGSVREATAILLFAQIVGDTTLMIFFINAVSLRQAVTPDRLLGRVNASFQVVIAAVGPLGFLLGGLLGEAIGMRPTLFIAATGSWIGTAILLASPVRTMRTLPVIDSATE